MRSSEIVVGVTYIDDAGTRCQVNEIYSNRGRIRYTTRYGQNNAQLAVFARSIVGVASDA
jgi:hypothetical protein